MLVPYLRVCSAKPRLRAPQRTFGPPIASDIRQKSWGQAILAEGALQRSTWPRPRVTSDGDLEGLLALDLWSRYRGGTPTGSSVSLSLQALVPRMLCCSAER